LISEANGRPLPLKFSPRQQGALQPYLLPGEEVYWAGGHCDCGTPLGGLRRDAATRETALRRIDQKAAKLRSEGWSQKKIARWKGDKAPRPNTGSEDDQSVLGSWASLLHQATSRGLSPGLFLAWESGRKDDVIPVRTASVPISLATPDWLAHIEENVLYRFQSAKEH
jgi:hypothetical protein